MEIERLKELRGKIKATRDYYAAWNQSTNDEDDLLALIDAEIARQSVTDEAVLEAIEDLLSSYSCDMRLARMYLETPVLLKSVGLAITALRKMVKPQ